jgi:hypothetical protein
MEIYSGILGFVITSGIYKWHLTSEKPIFRSYKFISHVGKGGVIRAQGLTSSRADPILPSSHNGLNWIVRGCRTARVGEWVLFCPKLPLTGQHRQRNQYWGIVFICFARCPGLGKTYLHRQICSRACTHLRTLTLTQTHTHTHTLSHTHTHSLAEVKNAADWTAASNNDGGVAEALNRYVLWPDACSVVKRQVCCK